MKIVRYYVVREYSGVTAKKQLVSILSRGIKNRLDAEQQMRFEASNPENKGKKVFLMMREHDE